MMRWLFLITLLAVSVIEVTAQTEDISFTSSGITLSGTLLKPRGIDKCPVIVFVHGSGVSTRSDFKDLASDFVKLGYGALIYDKRGTGKSGGDPKTVDRFSFDELSEDVVAAVEFANAHGGASLIGIYAASQGGWVAPLAATKTDKIKFMIIQSGSVTTVGDDNIFERSARLKREGFTESEVAEAREMHVADNELTRHPESLEPFRTSWDKYKAAKWFQRVYAGEALLNPNHPYRVWYRTVVDFDPRPLWEKLSVPVLFLYGEASLDRFCPVQQSVEAVKTLKGMGKNVEIMTFKEADHNLVVGKRKVKVAEEAGAWLKRTGF